MSDLELVSPTLWLRDAYLDMAADFQASREYYSYHNTAQVDFVAFLDELADYAQGRNLPSDYVPMNSYWLLENGTTMLGESRLRHYLSPDLKIEGGHIGYAIRPSERRKGYGTQILALTLEKVKIFGLDKVMVTCDFDNTASAKIIEKNGGRLTGMARSPRSDKQVLHYWIRI